MKPPVTVILFDIDGTLLNTRGAGANALRHAFAETWGIPVDQVPQLKLAGATDAGLWQLLVSVVPGAEADPVRESLFHEHYLRRLDENFRGDHFLPRLCPGAAELVRCFHESDRFVLGLLTGNLKAGADLKVDHFDLGCCFEFGAFGDEDADRDVLARIAVERARNLPEVSADSPIWVFGDTPKDIACARAAGVSVLAVATGSCSLEELASHEPDALLSDFADLEVVLEYFQENAD